MGGRSSDCVNVHVDALWEALNMKARSPVKAIWRRWPSVPQHDDQANNTPVKERIRIGQLCFIQIMAFRCVELLFQPKTCELPDENIFVVHAKRFRCAGVLFQPCFTSRGS